MFAKETYTTRRNSLKKPGNRSLAILGNEESGDYADNTYHFRQDSTFLYFLGLALCRIGDMDIILYGWDPACLV